MKISKHSIILSIISFIIFIDIGVPHITGMCSSEDINEKYSKFKSTSGSNSIIRKLIDVNEYLDFDRINIYFDSTGSTQIKYNFTFIKKNIAKDNNNIIPIPKNNTSLKYFQENLIIYNNDKIKLTGELDYKINEKYDCFMIEIFNKSEKYKTVEINAKFKNEFKKLNQELYTVSIYPIFENYGYLFKGFDMNISYSNYSEFADYKFTLGGSVFGKIKEQSKDYLNVSVKTRDSFFRFAKVDFYGFPFVYGVLNKNNVISNDELIKIDFKKIDHRLSVSLRYYYKYIVYVFFNMIFYLTNINVFGRLFFYVIKHTSIVTHKSNLITNKDCAYVLPTRQYFCRQSSVSYKQFYLDFENFDVIIKVGLFYTIFLVVYTGAYNLTNYVIDKLY